MPLMAAVFGRSAWYLERGRHIALAEEIAHLLPESRIGNGGQVCLLLEGAHICHGWQAFNNGVIQAGAEGDHAVPPDGNMTVAAEPVKPVVP